MRDPVTDPIESDFDGVPVKEIVGLRERTLDHMAAAVTSIRTISAIILKAPETDCALARDMISDAEAMIEMWEKRLKVLNAVLKKRAN